MYIAIYNMNQRLQQFLSAENVSQSQFADKIGVARASVSHILTGRNRPGFDFIENVAKFYPSLNLEWLITGKGKMYKEVNTFVPNRNIESSEEEIQESLFPEPKNEEKEPVESAGTVEYGFEEKSENGSVQPEKTTVAGESRGIDKIIVFFDDGTYQELK